MGSIETLDLRAGLEMVVSSLNIVQAKIVERFCVAPHFSITCENVTSVDNQSWISIHVYMIWDLKRTSMLLTLERVTKGGEVENITNVIVDALTIQGGLTPTKLGTDSWFLKHMVPWYYKGRGTVILTSCKPFIRHTCNKCIV